MPVHKINFFLDVLSQTADHQRLFGYANTLTAMQHVFSKIIPPRLASHCALGGLSNGKLTILANSGAIAARLRQTVPSLLLKFQANGCEVTAIRIAVQANSPGEGSNVPAPKRSVNQAGRESLRRLATELPPSPLKTSVESLLYRVSTTRPPTDVMLTEP
jgi:Dna[CI] antecedent, DciA